MLRSRYRQLAVTLVRLVTVLVLLAVPLLAAPALGLTTAAAAPAFQSTTIYATSVDTSASEGSGVTPVAMANTLGAPDSALGGFDMPMDPDTPYIGRARYTFAAGGFATHFQVYGCHGYVVGGELGGPWENLAIFNATRGEWESLATSSDCNTFSNAQLAVEHPGELYTTLQFYCEGNNSENNECRWDAVSMTGVPAPTATPNTVQMTETAIAGQTQTQIAAQTQTQGAAQTATSALATAFPGGPGSHSSANRLINTDFNVAPRMAGYGWTDIGRVAQTPILLSGDPIDHMDTGSCGPKYWVMSTPLNGDKDETGRIRQDFTWNGGQMFINLEGLTDDYSTRGRVSIWDKTTGGVEPILDFSNGSFSWLTFKGVSDFKPAGEYTFAVDVEGFGSRPAAAIDNVNLRSGYYGNDCDDDYYGQMPQQQNATATPQATTTVLPPGDGVNMLKNCGFEQGMSSWAPNAGSRLFYTGGATGPTYNYLFTVYDNGSDGPPINTVGRVWQPFNWQGGQMFVTYFTGPGTRMSSSIRNLFSGSVYNMQSAAFGQNINGWIKRSYAFPVSDPGQYIIEFRGVDGQIAAIDGVTVSAGTFASGECSSANSSGNNNATATAHATSSQIAATTQPAAQLTAHAVQTTQAAGYDDYLTAQYATMTQRAGQTQTAAPLQTQTANAAKTQTQSARQTATAQGTPQPSLTPTPPATATPAPTVCVIDPVTGLCWIVAPPVTVVVPDADLTATALAAGATGTAQAQAAETQFVSALQTAQAKFQATQFAAQTQTAAPAQAATAAAAIQQTATARAVQTQIAAGNQTAAAINATQTAIAIGISAQQTAAALATQNAQQQAATQTAVAVQTEIAGADPATQAAATSTAAAHATQFAGVTATAVAQLTADAAGTAAAQATSAAQATANQAATAVMLATLQAQQAASTATAAAIQTQLADDPDPTAEAEATTTAQAAATSAAQTTATAQSAATSLVGTQIAQGTPQPQATEELPPVDVRPEPGPGVDCLRPSSPLQIANWIDYSICRVLSWFSWSQTNTDQVLALQDGVTQYQPFGFIGEWVEVFGLLREWAGSLPWCDTGFCNDQPLAPLNVAATGLLVGDFDLLPGTPYYSDECDILLAPLVGPAIQSGACFCVNVLCALGILPWAQLMFNITLAFVALVYIQRTWLTSAHA